MDFVLPSFGPEPLQHCVYNYPCKRRVAGVRDTLSSALIGTGLAPALLQHFSPPKHFIGTLPAESAVLITPIAPPAPKIGPLRKGGEPTATRDSPRAC